MSSMRNDPRAGRAMAGAMAMAGLMLLAGPAAAQAPAQPPAPQGAAERMLSGKGQGARAAGEAARAVSIAPQGGGQAPAAGSTAAPAAGPRRADPFSRDTVLQATPEPDGRRRFVPAATLPQDVPLLTLLGIAKPAGDRMAGLTALLRVDQMGAFVVREGDTISLQRRRRGAGGDDVLRIKTISEQSVTVEAGSFGELIVVR